MNHPASFAVRLNGAQGKMAAKVHSPSGALEECVVTELEKGLCVFSRQHIAANRRLEKPQNLQKRKEKTFFVSNQTLLSSRQVRRPVHPEGERYPLHRRQVQRLSHPWKSFPGPSRGARTDRRAWPGLSVRSWTGERHDRWVTCPPVHLTHYFFTAVY